MADRVPPLPHISTGRPAGGVTSRPVRTYPECIPCILRASLNGARQAGTSDPVAWTIATKGAHIAAGWDQTLPPILLGAEVGRVLRRTLGVADPYHAAKGRANVAALARYPEWKREVARAADPLLAALRLAAAANSLDLGLHAEIDPHRDVARAPASFAHSDYAAFREALGASDEVLFLTDNAGEIVLDRILIEELLARGHRVTVAVRGSPTLNDATTDDARAVGLEGIARIITTGSDVPGVFLPSCSGEFQERFWGADLILAKGMGNFEGLSQERAPLFFLLQAKCAPVARETGVDIGDLVLLRGSG